MKNLNRILILVLLCCGGQSFAQTDNPVLPGPVSKETLAGVKIVPIEEVFVPGGFDDNDVTEIIVKGTMPNSCWKVAGAQKKYNEQTKTYQIYVTSFTLENQVCLPVTSTFVETVKLGKLQADDYTIEGTTPAHELISKNLHVKHSDTVDSDNYLYAQVDSIHLLKSDKFPVGYEIQGQIPPMEGTCLALSEVDAQFDSTDVLTVLPILKKTPAENCTPDELIHGRSFSKRLYENNTPTKAFLIHARSINGHSVTRYVPVY